MDLLAWMYVIESEVPSSDVTNDTLGDVEASTGGASRSFQYIDTVGWVTKRRPD